MNRTAPAEARLPLLWWDLATTIVVLVVSAIGVAETFDGGLAWLGATASQGLRVALMILPAIAFVLLYALLGRRVLRNALRGTSTAAGTVFLAALVAVVGWGAVTDSMYALLQVLAYPIAWSVAPRYREAVDWSAGIALVVGAGMFAGLAVRSVEAAFFSALITAPISFVFAVAMGTWITRIFERGEAYRSLAEELGRSQAEVAALSEASGAAAERERLSRELHDTLTQTLAGLVMLSEQAERALDAGDGDQARDRLGRVSSAAREAVAEARALVATTQPLGDGGLEAALERIAQRLRADTGLEVTCGLADVPLDRERQVVVLRAAQEGLANARKHARASRVAVTLEAAEHGGVRRVVLRVDDDGVGPTPEAVGGFGLSGLAERVRAVGGSVAFGPGERGGARLEVRLPPDARDAREESRQTEEDS